MTDQIAPPLKFSGDCVIRLQISASFSFQTLRALIRFCTIQLSDTFFYLRTISSYYQIQDLFGKGDYHTSRKGKKSVRSLGRVVALK